MKPALTSSSWRRPASKSAGEQPLLRFHLPSGSSRAGFNQADPRRARGHRNGQGYGRPVSAPTLHRRVAQHVTGTSAEATGRDGRRPVIRNARMDARSRRRVGAHLSKLFDPGKLDRVYDLPPGGAIRVRNEGVGLMAALFKAVEDAGIDVWYDSPAADLLTEGSTVVGVLVRQERQFDEVRGAVVLACGGFRSQSRDAPPLPRSGLGPRQGTGHPLQHGHHARPGLVRRRPTGWPLGRLPCQSPGCSPSPRWGPASDRQAEPLLLSVLPV